ncbi:MAG: hypothetical protein WC222_09520 [Parachlamydiales bacterium]|jgi:triacylglycerol esterase/lipase EstA (alpha/beta hydrolase family)
MSNIKLFIVSFALLFCSILNGHSIEHQRLVTIHGFLGDTWNMKYMASGYSDKHVYVKHWAYPSRDKLIQEHGADLAHYLQKLARKKPGVPINFITHSMGGLVLRSAMNHPECPPEAKIGRAALLAPPNQGAGWGRFLDQYYFSHLIGKEKAGKQLRSQADFEFLGQFPDTVQVLVIAGTKNINPWIKGKSDSTVTVDETRLNTPHQHKTVHAEHTMILFSKRAYRYIKEFFKQDL